MSCETLLALELIGANAANEDRLKLETRPAIKSLRRAITELRKASAEPTSALAYGFVLATTPTSLSALSG
jgi:hypothetical protein